jgi:hypothetical protein
MAAMIGVWVTIMMPLDLLGGYLLPNRSRPGTIAPGSFVSGWVRGAIVQAMFYYAAGVLTLWMGRSYGLPGACVAILAFVVLLIAFQLQIARLTAGLPKLETSAEDKRLEATESNLEAALNQTVQWGWESRKVVLVQHCDPGFTGGVVGLPGMERIVLPAASAANLTMEQLAIMIARRIESIRGGSRVRGVIFAAVWVLVGFAVSASIPGAGVDTVGRLAMTCCGFTLWSFLGLLTLPTLSRQASYAIDRQLIGRGVREEAFHRTLQALDKFQDDEPKRSKLIETIFHPVPSVENRRDATRTRFPFAWHAARMALFLSWSCIGSLSRAVHCNAGRPELWVMLPTD